MLFPEKKYVFNVWRFIELLNKKEKYSITGCLEENAAFLGANAPLKGPVNQTPDRMSFPVECTSKSHPFL